MRGINHAHYIGSIAQKPELRYTTSGLAILDLTVAGKVGLPSHTTPRYATFYNRCKCFGGYAEKLAETFAVGDVVSVLGRLDYRTWDTDDGQKRAVTDTVIESVQRLEGSFGLEHDTRGQPLLQGALNRVTLGGNLTRDSELRHTPGGEAVITHQLAVNESYTDKSGVTQERTLYIRVEAWRDLAEASQHATLGSALVVVGRLTNDSWTDKEGNKRYGVKLEAERLHFASRGRTPDAPQPTPNKIAAPAH